MNHDLNITFCINLSIKISSKGGGLVLVKHSEDILACISKSCQWTIEQWTSQYFCIEKQNYFLSFFQQNSITLYTWNIYKRNTVHYIFFIYMLPPLPSHHFSRKIHVIIFEIVFVLFFWNIFWIFLFLLFSLDSNLLDVPEETIWKYKHTL